MKEPNSREGMWRLGDRWNSRKELVLHTNERVLASRFLYSTHLSDSAQIDS